MATARTLMLAFSSPREKLFSPTLAPRIGESVPRNMRRRAWLAQAHMLDTSSRREDAIVDESVYGRPFTSRVAYRLSSARSSAEKWSTSADAAEASDSTGFTTLAETVNWQGGGLQPRPPSRRRAQCDLPQQASGFSRGRSALRFSSLKSSVIEEMTASEESSPQSSPQSSRRGSDASFITPFDLNNALEANNIAEWEGSWESSHLRDGESPVDVTCDRNPSPMPVPRMPRW